MMARTTKAVAALLNPTGGEAAIREFVDSSFTSEQLRQRAAPLLDSKELPQNVQRLAPEDQTKFVDKVDRVYPTINSKNARFVTALGNVCSATEQLPISALLSTGLENRGNIAVASGGLTDVWRGKCGGKQVAIEAFRIHPRNLEEAKEILWKRVPMWRKLSHENILSFGGVNMTLFQLALVYDWGKNGNITQYIASHPRASRLSLLFGVAKGLEYLHSLDLPHGCLKGTNVVVDEKGHARLTEYGLAPITSGPSFTVTASPEAVGSSRWLAPEIMNPSRKGNGVPVMESKPADVFAFAMLAVEVFTGKVPFEEVKNEAVVLQILRGGRPAMPGGAQAVGLTSEVWKLLESCWQQNPKKRPTMGEVVRRWEWFIKHNDDSDTVTETPRRAAKPGLRTSRPWVKSETTQLRTKSKVARSQANSESVQPPGLFAAPWPSAGAPKRRRKWFWGLF